ncbi:MAG: glycosyltransferase family 4 protein [Acidobacteriota bacterium]
MKVLALASYPVEAAATRFRLQQYVAPLAKRGIAMTIHPFLDADAFAQFYRRDSLPPIVLAAMKSSVARVFDLVRAQRADVIFVQRDAMLFGPPWFEWLAARMMKRPMVLDLDDATYVAYKSPTYGGLGKALKWFSKTDDLIRWAEVVVCGNSSIADYVRGKGARTEIVPTVVDTDIFKPVADKHTSDEPILGWIGTHSTFPYLQSIFPVLSSLAQRHKFRLKIVGAGQDVVEVPGVTVESLPWRLDREVGDFQSVDIGLYPIDESIYEGWASGKSGFKSIQYMAVGVPYVATPVGGSAEIGRAGVTHLTATTHEEWHHALADLITNPEQRRMMGAAGREHVTRHYALDDQADKLAAILRSVAAWK